MAASTNSYGEAETEKFLRVQGHTPATEFIRCYYKPSFCRSCLPIYNSSVGNLNKVCSAVTLCRPELPNLVELLGELNRGGQFDDFVKAVRRAFKEAV